MALTVNVPAPQPKLLLEPELSKLEPVYHLSMEEEAAIATKGVRVMVCVTFGAIRPLYGMGQKVVRTQPELFQHLQSVLRSQSLQKYDIECICIPGKTGNDLVAVKSVSQGSGPIAPGDPPPIYRIPNLKISESENTIMPRIKDSYTAFRDGTSGQTHKISPEHTILTCVVTVATRPASSRQPQRREISLTGGRMNGQEIDIKKAVDRLQNYFPAIYAFAAARKYQPFAAKLDCSKIVGQDRWLLQRWAEPMSIENYAQRTGTERGTQSVQPAVAGRGAPMPTLSATTGAGHPPAARPVTAPTMPRQHAQAPRQDRSRRRQADGLRTRHISNQGIPRSQAAAENAEANTIGLNLRFEICRAANGSLGLKRAVLDSNIPAANVKVGTEHLRQVYRAMQTARTSVGFVIFRCRHNGEGNYETIEAVQDE